MADDNWADSLTAAVSELQRDLPHVGKTADAQYGKYADLATVTKAIMPKLAEVGLAFIAKPTMSAEGFALVYRLMHVSGQSEDGVYPLPASGTPQQIGSAITYARRYCLCAVTGVAPVEDDDDGQAADRLITEARAMRRKDPEVDQHGAATVAEQTRMMTGPEPGTQRGPLPAADDPWLDGPAGLAPQDDPEDRHGTATADQIRSIQAGFTAKGIKDRDIKIDYLRKLFGPDIHSSKDLTYNQAAQALQEMR